MIDLHFRPLNPSASVQKNVLYKIDENRVVPIPEKHELDSEVVNLEYSLEEKQYAILGNEYRSPSVEKRGCKTADILTCVVDGEKKKIYSLVLDIKRNISAFSDDLFRDSAMLVAIKDVRDFIEQLHDENLHKNSFLIYYQDEGYTEQLEFGIATKSFEGNKFLNVADFLDNLDNLQKPSYMQQLVWLKFKTNLKPYMSEAVTLRNFASRSVCISGILYELKVFILEKVNDLEYATTIPIKLN